VIEVDQRVFVATSPLLAYVVIWIIENLIIWFYANL